MQKNLKQRIKIKIAEKETLPDTLIRALQKCSIPNKQNNLNAFSLQSYETHNSEYCEVNIVLGGDKNFNANISRKGASIYLNHEGIELDSEGNIAGLQFEHYGLHPGELILMLPGYEFAGSFKKDKFVGVIFKFQ